jgi:hypothetical protein
MRHKLDLQANALDSLNEGLRKYSEAEAGTVGAYKFAVLHFAHFMELYLKAGVAKEHSLLIYVKPASQKLEGALTVGLWDAVNILRNAGHILDPHLLADLDWLKKLRNNIEHYEFDLEVPKVREVLGRILRAADEVSDTLELPSLREHVDQECQETFDQLLGDYKALLARARRDARRLSEEGEVTNCSYCGELEVAYESDGEIQCVFCGESEPLRECVICTETYRDSECSVWNDDHPGPIDYACTYCEDRIFGED